MNNSETEMIAEDLIIDDENTVVRVSGAGRPSGAQRTYLIYLLLPSIFLIVTFLGGLRFAAIDNAFVFLKPPLLCLVFATMSLILYFRSHLIDAAGWFSEEFSTLQNIANGAVLLTLFSSTVQLFNSLLPESGLPFWVIGFCFFWTLWNNFFADLDTRKLLQSLVAMFTLAFVVKYLVLANLAAPTGGSWLQRVFENPGKETLSWLLDLPRYSAGTGYVQFFTITLYLLGLYLTPRSTNK